MKIERKPTAAFAEVAKALAKDTPPEWLVPLLARYSPLVSGRRPNEDDDADDRRLLKAAQDLEKGLSVYAIAEEKFGLSNPDCVDTVLSALPELIEYLEGQLRPPSKGGPKPDGHRRICAAVCANVWRRERGEVQPFSNRLWQACEDYWRACGNPETSTEGRLKNWEPFLVWVQREDDEGFRENFERLIADHLTTQPK